MTPTMTIQGARAGGGFITRNLTKILSAAAGLIMSGLLLVTMYFTLFDLQWMAFLLGILFAGVAALVSQSAKAHWLVLRRESQLRRARSLLSDQMGRAERAGKVSKMAEARLASVCGALSTKILFVDRNERCRYHNAAFQHWCGHGRNGIVGVALRGVMDAPLYEALQACVPEALKGKEQSCEASWQRASGQKEHAQVTLLPFPAGAERPIGFYVLLDSRAAATVSVLAAAGGVRTAPVPEAPAALAPSAQLMGADPRARLVQALEENHFILFAQKIAPVSPRAEHRQFQEVLLRLREDEHRLVPPGGFLPLAERYNLMGDIDRWVVRNLLEWCALKQREESAWQSPLYCVNLSQASILDDGFARHVSQQIDSAKASGQQLCFEVAADHLREHGAEVRRLMSSLRVLGCRFVVDGLDGTQDSLAMLRKLNFDFFKIDGFTILNMLADGAELAKVEAITSTCRKLRVPTIAQFVESDDIRVQVTAVGVDYVQGFGIGKPDVLARVGEDTAMRQANEKAGLTRERASA